jgi:hypothetical protein
MYHTKGQGSDQTIQYILLPVMPILKFAFGQTITITEASILNHARRLALASTITYHRSYHSGQKIIPT